MVYWTHERLLEAFERHFWHPTMSALAEELSSIWGRSVSPTGVQKALKQGFPGHAFRETIGSKKREAEAESRVALVTGQHKTVLQDKTAGQAESRIHRLGEPENAATLPTPRLRIAVIPDTQVKPGVPIDHLTWAGRYIADHPVDVVIHLGDHWDMPSLSSYDAGKRGFEERRYIEDVESGNVALQNLTDEIHRGGHPRLILLRGNHEDRIERLLDVEPRLEGAVGQHQLLSPGWEVVQFKDMIEVGGILFSHYFYNPRSGRPWSGQIVTMLKNIGCSFVQGHRQGLEVGLQQLPTGERRRGIVAGSFYMHDEKYLGPQGDHWRGILYLNEVKDGDFDVCEISLDYLRRNYS